VGWSSRLGIRTHGVEPGKTVLLRRFQQVAQP
jgi:hypothetical protein